MEGNVEADCGVGFTGEVFPFGSVFEPKAPLVTPVTVADLVVFELTVVVQKTVGCTVAVGGCDGEEPPIPLWAPTGDTERISGPAG